MAHIGVVFGQRTQLWWDLPVIESYDTAAPHLPHAEAARTATSSSAWRSCSRSAPLLDVPVRKLSLGQRMRCELGAALLHAPDLLFLDEPTIGLDVVAKEAIREFLATENRERGTTILLTTHDLADIERLCPRMILIDHGRVVYDGSVEAIRRLVDRRAPPDASTSRAPRRPSCPTACSSRNAGRARLVLRFDRERIAARPS